MNAIMRASEGKGRKVAAIRRVRETAQEAARR